MARIGFIVDHPKRDLAGGAMLAHALARRGIETALVPLYDQAIDVPLLGLDGLIVNFARPVNLELVKAYREAGIPVWVLDTEGGILAEDGANSPDRLARYIAESGFAGLLSGYFFWGPVLHDAFVRSSTMARATLHLTGCPRFDFAAPPWRDVLAFDRDGYVLVNANFPLVNPLFASSGSGERASLVAAGWKGEYVDRMIEDSTATLERYIATIGRLAASLPDQSFLVRPHPFENAERYRTEFAALPNVAVDGRGSVLNAIHHAAGVVHLNCGTAVEALMLDKVPLSMEFLNTEHLSRHTTLPSRVSLRVHSEDELAARAVDFAASRRSFDIETRYRELVEPWFHRNDGRAAERIAAVLADAVAGKARARPSLRRSLASSRRGASSGQRLQAGLANLIGSYAATRLRATAQPRRKAKLFRAGDVDPLLDALARQAGVDAGRAAAGRHPVSGAPLASVLVTPPGA